MGVNHHEKQVGEEAELCSKEEHHKETFEQDSADDFLGENIVHNNWKLFPEENTV